MRRLRCRVLLHLASALSFAACSDERAAPAAPPPAPGEIDMRLGLAPGASPKIFEAMRKDRSTPRHASDGGGRAWIASVSDADGKRIAPLRAGDRARIRLIFEAGPLGIATGGSIVFRIPPWWEWDPPQPDDPEAPGYTQVLTTEGGPQPELFFDAYNLTLKFKERAVAPGERLYFVYGAGPELARVDAYAERREQLRFEVDGDGDRVRALIAESPRLDIAAGPPAQLRVVIPTTALPGESVPVRVSVLDRNGNTGVPFAGEVRLSADAGLELPASIRFTAERHGRQTVAARVVAAGVLRATAVASPGGLPEPLQAVSNPLVVAPDAPRLYWADLHGHSQLSDGSGTPEDYYTYARDVSGLDAAALTDHDHWGIEFVDERPAMWDEIRAAATRFHAPGQFITLLGYEWTSLLHGHRHVLYFTDDGTVLSAFDDRYQTPHQLWDALRGRSAFTFAHHSAGGPIATNWRYRPDPELEPVTEIASVHGNSESLDGPLPIYDPVEGNFVRDVLDDGVRLGFIGSGDSHDGQPGVSHRAMQYGFGLAAIRADELSREAIRRALAARRVYATNGARIFLDVSIDGAPMGSLIEASRDPRDATLRVRVVAESPLERIDLVTRGEVVPVPLAGEVEWSNERPIAALQAGDYHYVRVIQRDGGAAWSSPIFAE